MIKVTVVVPVYNAGLRLKRCLTSLAAQTYADIEFIVVDDHSSDNSIEVLEGFLTERPDFAARTTVLRHDVNRGSAAARKTGMQAATGDYIIHVDSDDHVDPQYIEMLATTAAATGADVVICDMAKEWESGKRQVLTTPANQGPEQYLALALSGEIYCSLCNKLMRRSLFVDHDVWPVEGLDMLDDKSVVVRALYYARKFAVVNTVLYHYDKSGTTSITGQSKQRHIAQAKQYHAVIDNFFADKQVPALCREAIETFRLATTAQQLLYGTRDDDTKRIVHSASWSAIWSHPTIPLHYKLALACHKLIG